MYSRCAASEVVVPGMSYSNTASCLGMTASCFWTTRGTGDIIYPSISNTNSFPMSCIGSRAALKFGEAGVGLGGSPARVCSLLLGLGNPALAAFGESSIAQGATREDVTHLRQELLMKLYTAVGVCLNSEGGTVCGCTFKFVKGVVLST